MSRKWQIRIVVLIVLFAFGVYLRLHRRATSYIKRYDLVDVKDSTQIAELSIIKGNDTISIKKAGTGWAVFMKGKKLPANNARVWELVNKVINARYQIASENASQPDVYGIDSTSFLFSVKTDNGKVVTLKAGKRGPTYSSFYFVFPGKKKIYLLMGIPRYTISTDVSAYRDKSVVDFKKEDIKSLVVYNGKDSLVIKREKDTFISIPERDSTSIMATINRARVITAFGFAEDEPDSVTGLMNTNKKMVFVTQSDDTTVVYIGNKGKYALYVATSKRPGEVFKVYKNWFDDVLKKAKLLTDFKK